MRRQWRRPSASPDFAHRAGIPIHRAAPHIGKLIAAGLHVAICDQVSEPGKGLVEREVTRVVTPGTVAEPGLISPQENNLIVALAWGRTGVGLAAADVTTGEVMTTVVDVFVLPGHRGQGHGKAIMQAVMSHAALQGLRRVSLATSNAHGLYAQFGFTAPAKPESLMEIYSPDIYQRGF